MLLKNILFLTFFISITCISQEKIGELKSSSSTVKNIACIVNEKNGDIAFFSTDPENLYGYLLDENFKLKSQVKIEKGKKYKAFLGYKINNDGNYIIYLSNNQKNKFKKVKLSFKKSTIISNDFSFLKEYETFIQTISINNNFYIISASKEAENLYIYTFNSFENNPERNIIDLNSINFLNAFGEKEKLTNLLIKKNPLIKFNNTIPNSIKITAEKRKMYIKKNTIVFSLDQYPMQTQLLTIDLTTLKASYKTITKPLEKVDRKKKVSNSFIDGDNLFSVASTKEELEFTITNIETGSVLKKLNINLNDEINFNKNALFIIDEGNTLFDNKKNASKFLKNAFKHKNIGINSYKVKGHNYLTIGSFDRNPKGNFQLNTNENRLTPFSTSDGISGYSVLMAKVNKGNFYFDDIQLSFDLKNDLVSNQKIKLVLDSELNPIQESTFIDIFDSIRNIYSPKNKIFLSSSMHVFEEVEDVMKNVVFKHKDYYILSYYDEETNSFKFLKI